MAKTVTGPNVNEAQKRFVKVLDSMTGRYSRWQIWGDMIKCYACAISNSTDALHREAREADYMRIISKYEQDERMKIAELGAILVESMEEDMAQGKYRDFLGELFMQLELGSNLGGQFFTPYSICKMMAKVTIDQQDVLRMLDERGWISVNDPACGAGATLIAAMEVLREAGVNYQQRCMFIAQDIDQTTALMCYIQLSLLGCAAVVRVDNTLTTPFTGDALFGGDPSDNNWYSPMFFSDIWQGRRVARRMDDMLRSMAPHGKRPEAVSPATAVDEAPVTVDEPVDEAAASIDEPRAKDEEPRTQNEEARAQYEGLCAHNEELRAHNEEPRAQSEEPTTQAEEPPAAPEKPKRKKPEPDYVQLSFF